MRLFFLEAAWPLTKTFTRTATSEIEKSAYPQCKMFTSHECEVNSLSEFYTLLTQQAALGHCVLKGLLTKPLVKESRAGATQPLDPTTWSCFDLDGVDVESPEDFIQRVLPPAFHDVSYILQYSASAGIVLGGLRVHLFFLHDATFTPEMAKLWITELNLTNAILSDQLSLSANGLALKFPLDRTVCQNDKLIYIAPPVLIGDIHDPYAGERISLVSKGKSRVSFEWRTPRTPPAIQAATHAKVNELRVRAGLKSKTPKEVVLNGELWLKNPDVAEVTGEQRARGFTYLNLNGGDSWGYYYPDDNPRYLYNFKGEHIMALKDFVPAYLAQNRARFAQARFDRAVVPFAFRHAETDTVWNGKLATASGRLTLLAPCSRQSLKDFFGGFNEDVPRIDDWRFEFEPSNLTRIDFATKFCNRWEPTDYILNLRVSEVMPPMIRRAIFSAVGNDEESFHHLLNWIAYIFQFRQKTMTAWILHGVEGTGKGVLFHRILTPLLGSQYCLIKQVAALDDRFNGEMPTCLLFLLDETKAENSAQGDRAIARLRNMITEPMIEIRDMRCTAVQCKSYTNFLLYSNNYDAYNITPSDRRFNVAPRQEVKLILTEEDLTVIDGELADFAAFLHGYQVDEQRAHTALNNAAKVQMREQSQDALEQICQAVNDGNLGYFLQYAESQLLGSDARAWANYQEVMKRWVTQAGMQTVVRRDDMMAVYMYLNTPAHTPGVHKFMRMLNHKNLISGKYYCAIAGTTVRGFRVKWDEPAELERYVVLLQGKEKQPHGSVTNLAGWKPNS